MRAPRTAAVLLALALLAACRSEGGDVRINLERMTHQPKAKAYTASPVFADGRAMQPPPPGTLPYGAAALPDVVLTGLLADGAPVERIPIRLSPELLEIGRDRFDVFCAACHGIFGDGESRVAAKMQLRNPPSFHAPNLRAMPAGRLFHVASDGYGLMPGYAEELSVAERWAVVAYIRALQLSQNAHLDALPPAVRAEAMQALQSQPGAAAPAAPPPGGGNG